MAWAGWGHHLAEQAGLDEPQSRSALRFDPDSLSRGAWDTVRAVEREPRAPDGHPWLDDASTLERLVSWAATGRFLLGVDLETDDADGS